MRAGKAEYTSAAIKRAAVHIWIAAKAAIIAIFFMLELHHTNVRFVVICRPSTSYQPKVRFCL
jgi:hypothetical protein